LARYLKARAPDVRERGVVVGRDGRRLSREFAEDVAAVLAAEGIPALFFPQVVPTPVTAFATLHLRAAAAVMVTASHNPPEYNGYKVYWGNGAQIVPPHDQGIAAAIDAVEPANQVRLMGGAAARGRGLWRDLDATVDKAYLDAIDALRLHRAPSPLSLVYTAMHGVGGRWAVAALERAGFRVHPVPEQQEPDGAFPTVRFPNPEEPGAMDLSLKLAERERADVVLANDPDADRLAVAARDGAGVLKMFTGNELGVLLGHYLLTQTKPLPSKPLVITTIVSSGQLGHIARELGAAYDETLTGFKWIANRALERERAEGAAFLFGYEEALGYTVRTVARDKDGVGAALVVADMAAWCATRRQTLWGYLEEIQRRFGLFVASQKSFTFPGTEGASTIAHVMDGFRRRPPTGIGAHAVRKRLDYASGELPLPPSNVLAYELEGGSRVTLRPSGTEPKVKYYFELREPLSGDEPIGPARRRGQERLALLENAFLALARERGQPS
jgi:phosphomannomutase